jgi:hypothetical protein
MAILELYFQNNFVTFDCHDLKLQGSQLPRYSTRYSMFHFMEQCVVCSTLWNNVYVFSDSCGQQAELRGIEIRRQFR